MKKIICNVIALMIALFVTSYVSAQTQSLSPKRTVDPVPAVHPITPSLPMKAGGTGGNKSVQPAGGLKTTVMPVKQGAAGATTGVAGAVGAAGTPGVQTGTAGATRAAAASPITSAATGTGKGPNQQ